jgi:hypothetical protein
MAAATELKHPPPVIAWCRISGAGPRHTPLSGMLPQRSQQSFGCLQICRIQAFHELVEYRLQNGVRAFELSLGCPQRCQVDRSAQCSNGLERIEARPEAVEQWVGEVNDVANRTLLPMAKRSWYLGANIPGKPRAFMPYAGGMIRYREICQNVAARSYEGFALS